MVENVCIRGESRLGYWIIIKKAPQSSVSVIGWHIWRHRVEPEAVFGAQLAASFCVNRWAEGISDHSWWSTERWPNEFTLRMQKGMRSIVIRFLMCFTLRAFVYMAQVWLQASQDESSRRKEDVIFPLTFWSHTFDGDVSRLPASVQRRQWLKSERSVSSHAFHIAPLELFWLIISFAFYLFSPQSRANGRFANTPWHAACDPCSAKSCSTSAPASPHLCKPCTR